MKDHNQELNDKEIRDLLKWRLLEQIEDDDLLTQKLTDMEAKLAFSNEALYVPSLQKEKELFDKLNRKTGGSFFKWILTALMVICLSAFLLYRYSDKKTVVLQKTTRVAEPSKNSALNYIVPLIVGEEKPENNTNPVQEPAQQNFNPIIDTSKKGNSERWLTADPGIKVDYTPVKQKYDPKFVDAYDNIPVLTPKQIAANNKLKDKLVRQLIKKDKAAWAYIPMGTEVLNGQKISTNAFYISTMEVTNNQYRVFLNDLLIKDKTDDYIKAVPDTTKWRIENRPFYDPMVKYYFWHPAYNDFPVLNISREGAKMYCDWLTNAVNEKIKADNSPEKVESLYINDLRIPNEIEWVTAARGKLGDIDYPWSSSPDKNSVQNMIGCYLCNFSIINYPDSLKKKSECSKLAGAITSAGSVNGDFYFTAKVNSYNPNNYGLFCISGNAAEMVWENETLKPITKGGSWNSDADHVKISAIENEDVVEGSPYIGFRPVFTASPKKR
jgi:formylglycine-generating enzyme required for sulfatase activity